MCEFSGKLIAWLDRELPDDEAASVERHVGQCAECRQAVSAYREVTDAFLSCYEAVTLVRPKRGLWRRAVIIGGLAAAAAILAAIFFRQPPVDKISYHPPSPPPAPMVAVRARTPVRRARIAKPIRPLWVAVDPTIEVELPAEALFPPGAVPSGFSFIADVRPQR
jgi:anti-sigma factor RsiW